MHLLFWCHIARAPLIDLVQRTSIRFDVALHHIDYFWISTLHLPRSIVWGRLWLLRGNPWADRTGRLQLEQHSVWNQCNMEDPSTQTSAANPPRTSESKNDDVCLRTWIFTCWLRTNGSDKYSFSPRTAFIYLFVIILEIIKDILLGFKIKTSGIQ